MARFYVNTNVISRPHTVSPSTFTKSPQILGLGLRFSCQKLLPQMLVLCRLQGLFLFSKLKEKKCIVNNRKNVCLHYENPPSLLIMLKSAGRFLKYELCRIIQNHTHHRVNWFRCCNHEDCR